MLIYTSTIQILLLSVYITITYLSLNICAAKSLAKKNLTDARAAFGQDLDIAEDLIVVNARRAQSPEMMQFRQTLRRAHDEIKVNIAFCHSHQNAFKMFCKLTFFY